MLPARHRRRLSGYGNTPIPDSAYPCATDKSSRAARPGARLVMWFHPPVPVNKKGAVSEYCTPMKKPLNNPIFETVVVAFWFKGHRQKGRSRRRLRRKRGLPALQHYLQPPFYSHFRNRVRWLTCGGRPLWKTQDPTRRNEPLDPGLLAPLPVEKPEDCSKDSGATQPDRHSQRREEKRGRPRGESPPQLL